MKYILYFGLNFKSYKKPLKVKLFSNNLMIDDFEVPDSLPEYYEYGICLPDTTPTKVLATKQYYFYKLDEQALGDQLTFEFENIDNNYTNGFMTKTGLFNLQTCGIIPEKMFLNFEKYKKKLQQKQPPYLKNFLQTDPQTTRYYYESGAFPFQKLHWTAEQYIEGKWKEQYVSYVFVHWFGGIVRIHVPLFKKHGLKMIHPFKEHKRWGRIQPQWYDKKALEKYYNKYYKDENIRNNNTQN